MERLSDKGLITEATAQVNHAHIEEVVAKTKVPQVYEIALVAHKNGVAVLEVSVHRRIFLVLFSLGEKGTFRQEPVVPVFHILKLGGIHMDGMQLQAHPGEFGRIPSHVFRMVSRSAGIGNLAGKIQFKHQGRV